MRYLLHIDKLNEISQRKKYLEQTFHIWFIVNNHFLGCFIVFESFPVSCEKDICLIYGHNYEIAYLFDKYIERIPEKSVYIISCLPKRKSSFYAHNKEVFIAYQDNNRVNLRHGEDFGFDFDVCDAEINLYNLNGSLQEKFSSEFYRLY